jgi:hypothetical protein
MMKLVILFTALLTVLTLQTVAFVQGQPITPAAPFGQQQPQQSQTEQQKPITAGTPFSQLVQGDQQQSQLQQSQQSQEPGQQGQQSLQQTPKRQDIVLLSARLNDDGFGGQQIVGEVKNNGTESAEFIQPFATFRDAHGAVVDTAFTYAEKERIASGDTSPFNILVISDVVKQQARNI